MRFIIVSLVLALQFFMICGPAAAASFDSKTIKISVDESLWEKYHIVNPTTASNDVEKIYKIKKIEVRLVAGEREFGSFTFTPQNNKPQKTSLLYGVAATLTIRIRATASEDVLWTSSYPFKNVGDDIVIKSMPAEILLHYPGI